MQVNIPSLLLGLSCTLLINACSNVNESLWHSLKIRDAELHPVLDAPKASEKPMRYDEYAAARKKALEQAE